MTDNLKQPESPAQHLERLHLEGAAKYGYDWFQANSSAVNAIQASGLRPEEHKLLGALIAIRLCQWKRRHATAQSLGRVG